MSNSREKQAEKQDFYEYINKHEIKSYDFDVDGKSLFEELIDIINQYSVLPEHYPEVIALWIMHTYDYQRFAYTPRLNITSPEKGCGKSTVLDIIGQLASKPLLTQTITKASFVRGVDAFQPTVLIDEVDEMFKDKENGHTLVAVLNGGYAYNGTYEMTVQKNNNHTPTRYKTFCPVALSGIKDIPHPALASRCIVLRMQKVSKYEIKQKAKLQTHKSIYRKPFEELQSKLLRWSQDVTLDDDPVMPDDWEARFCDNWRPLYAIAKSFDCKQKVIEIANSFIEDDADELNTRILKDLIDVFNGDDNKFSQQICDELNTGVEYGNFNFGKGITPRNLAKMLRPFGIRPKSIRGGKVAKGYKREDFVKPWEVRGWIPPELNDTPSQGNKTNSSCSYKEETCNELGVTGNGTVTYESLNNSSDTNGCNGVTPKMSIEERLHTKHTRRS